MPSRTGFAAIVALSGLLGAGCAATPLETDEIRDPDLRTIHDAFREVVANAHADPAVSWESGWVGNMIVHLSDGESAGLCWQWQELVYDGVRPAVEAVGWRVDAVGINMGTPYEHQAVVVYDPAEVERELVFVRPHAVYVLDAWDRGEPDIHRLDDWLAQYLIVFEDPRLVDLSRRDADDEDED